MGESELGEYKSPTRTLGFGLGLSESKLRGLESDEYRLKVRYELVYSEQLAALYSHESELTKYLGELIGRESSSIKK